MLELAEEQRASAGASVSIEKGCRVSIARDLSHPSGGVAPAPITHLVRAVGQLCLLLSACIYASVMIASTPCSWMLLVGFAPAAKTAVDSQISIG